MLDFLNNFESFFIKTYLFTPLIFVFILTLFSFLKNPVYLRRAAKTFLTFQFFFASALFLFANEINFSIFNFNFCFNRVSSILIFVLAFGAFLFSILSKTFIQKLHKLFWLCFISIFGLTNILILSDNLFISFGCIFWIFLCKYLLNTSFLPNCKKIFDTQLKSDIILLFIAIALTMFNFGRYFVLNDIAFDFSNFAENLYHISNFSIQLAFFGLLILAFRFFNFIPFNIKSDASDKINPYIASFNIFIFLIIGCLLFIKTYFVFDYLFYDNEEYIAIYLILNFLYYIILLLKQNTLIKFANIISSVLFIGGMFSIFSFEDKGMVSFLYSAVAILISLLFSFFIFMLLENKFKTNKIEDFLKISPKNRILKFFIIFGFLNLVKMPGLPLFTSFLIGLLMIFSTDYDGFILNLMPYVLIFGTFLVSIYVLNLLYKILIEPQAPISYDSVLSRHQVLVLFICAIAVIICGIYPQYFFDGNF